MKYDENKVDLSLLPVEALEAIAKVFEFGAKKYGAFNWRYDGENTEWRRSFSSLQRHLYAWSECQDIDPDSGLDHLSHAASQLMIMICHAKNHPEMDNRYKGEKYEDRRHSKRTKKKIHTKNLYYSQ